MSSPQPPDDSRSPPIISSRFADPDTPRPPHLSFRSSVPLLPTPGTLSKRHPTYEPVALRFWVVAFGCLWLALIGIALEIARVISSDNGGFDVPQKNVFSFASTQFLTSFFPSLIFIPLALMVRAFDWAIRLWNPYLLLSRGQASADETLLIDYVADSRPAITYNALKFKHTFVLISGFTPLAALLFQPLAGAIFSVRQLPRSSPATVQSIRAIGLSPDVNDLSAFAASAGYANAAVFDGIGDPSFVHGGWVTAEFQFPTNPYLNGSMTIDTVGIQTSVHCANPNQFTVNSVNTTATTISATSIDGCAVQVTINPTNADQQYAVVNVPGCGTNTSDVNFQPVFFWFWQQNPNNAAGVFCEPTIQLFDVTASALLSNNSLTAVAIIDNYPKPNNVSGPPLNGVPYNGLIFNSSTNPNVQSRANSIRTSIPNTIFRMAQQSAGGLQSVFQNKDGFMNYTTQVYSQHLSLATKTNYFVLTNKTVNATLTRLVPRLYVEPLAAHVLATICISVAGTMFIVHLLHFRQRRNIYLAHPPGSIGSAVALTSHSGFGELLMPYNSTEEFSRALASLRFCLDGRTGAIVVDDSAIGFAGGASMRTPTPGAIKDETMMTLMEKGDGVGSDSPRVV